MRKLRFLILELIITAAVIMSSCMAIDNNRNQASGDTPYRVINIEESLGASEYPDYITLTWTDDPKTTMTVTWRSGVATDTAMVKYRQTGAGENSFLIKNAIREELSASLNGNKGKLYIYYATLTGLKPGTQYEYMAVNEAYVSEMLSFYTEAEKTDSFKFLVFGDSQSGNSSKPDYHRWNETLSTAYNQNRDSRFFVNMGDLVETGQSYDHWYNWFAVSRKVISSIPAVPVQGNHETYGYSETSKPEYFLKQFKLKQNGPDGLKGQVYSFNYGNVHFSILDSQQDEESPKSGDILKRQSEWLKKDLEYTRLPLKIVMFHKAVYNNRSSRNDDDIKAAFSPVIEKYNVDFVFNAHDHCISRTYPVKDGKLLSSGSEGTIYYIVGRSGEKFYNDVTIKPWNEFFVNTEDQSAYMVVQVEGTKISITAKKLDGTLIDTYTKIK